MQKVFTGQYRGWIGVALAACLMGCGASDPAAGAFSTGGGFAGSGEFAITGRVLSESGLPLKNVRLVAHERTSNARVEGVSGERGEFRMPASPGVYDLGMDLENDSKTATCFYGPLDSAPGGSQDFVLHESGGRPAQSVFGKLWLNPGVPARQRKLNLVTDYQGGSAARPADVTGRTLNDGSFELALASPEEAGLNIEVFDGQEQLDEFLDVGKLKKPCYAEFVTEQSSTKNRLRASETDPPAAFKAKSDLPDDVNKFDFSFLYEHSAPIGFSLDNGEVPADNRDHPLVDIVNPINEAGWDRFLQPGGKTVILRVETTNNYYFFQRSIKLGFGSPGGYKFTDRTGDVYSLWFTDSFFFINWRTVNYNSDSPNIVRMQYRASNSD